MEIYKKWRPTDLDDVVGQDEAVKRVRTWLNRDEVPHAVLLHGPSGTGKTTLARIIAAQLGVSKWDLQQINASDFRGVDTIRDIRRDMGKQPMGGKARCWVIDECHGLTKDAQNAMLAMLEDTPPHVYFLLATTDPGKLLKTIQTRCSELACKPVSAGKLTALVAKVAAAEKIAVGKDALLKLVEIADGSARKALVLLENLIEVADDEAQCEALDNAQAKSAAFNLVKALMPFKGKPEWTHVQQTLNDLAGEDPEGLRRMVLASAKTAILKRGCRDAGYYYRVLRAFERNFFDSGFAGVVIASYEALHGS